MLLVEAHSQCGLPCGERWAVLVMGTNVSRDTTWYQGTRWRRRDGHHFRQHTFEHYNSSSPDIWQNVPLFTTKRILHQTLVVLALLRYVCGTPDIAISPVPMTFCFANAPRSVIIWSDIHRHESMIPFSNLWLVIYCQSAMRLTSPSYRPLHKT